MKKESITKEDLRDVFAKYLGVMDNMEGKHYVEQMYKELEL